MEYGEILHRCFRCGYCKFPSNFADYNCPSYLKFRFETYSPGGRMWLLRGMMNNEIEPGRRMQEIMFSCTSCGNCVEHCAMSGFRDQILLAFTAAREELVNSGKVPPMVRDYLTNLTEHGNPYKMPDKKRSLWAEEAGVEKFSNHEYLFFLGDVGTFDDRGREIASSVARLLKKLGVSFGVLDHGLVSDGNDAKAMGEKELFQYLAEKNIKTFKDNGVRKIITLSPHGFNALKNDYPGLGGDFQVFHYTQVMAFLMGKLSFRRNEGEKTKVTFHDPCYLGRHNKDYLSARMILSKIPGVEIQEMTRNKGNALCCGGGGGNFFTDILGGGPNGPARARAEEAVQSEASIIAVACPICAVMLEEAVKGANLGDGALQVKEISELVLMAL